MLDGLDLDEAFPIDVNIITSPPSSPDSFARPPRRRTIPKALRALKKKQESKAVLNRKNSANTVIVLSDDDESLPPAPFEKQSAKVCDSEPMKRRRSPSPDAGSYLRGTFRSRLIS
jgi:hypothetical protein